MEINEKLKILADAAKYDASCASSGSRRERRDASRGLGHTEAIGVCHSYTPDGRCVSLLKLLLTNYCIFDCTYCVNRTSSDTPRARFAPEEIAALTVDFYRRNYIEGLFLSSGIIQSPDYTMELLIRTAKLLREEYEFNGYIHLKAAPGAAPELLREAGRWADRLSVNIELPVQKDLDRLAPAKTHDQIEATMTHIKDGIDEARDEIKNPEKESFVPARTVSEGKQPSFAPAGQSTQMIVGATPSPDAVILTKATSLYRRYRLRRVYYSAFSPIPHADSRLPLERTPLEREHRLYQADWLIRFYGFNSNELTTPLDQNLSLEHDPKLAWALRRRDFFPVDVNRASRSVLLRVPGLGVRNVERILEIRRYHRLTLEDLAKLRVTVDKVRWFVVTANHHPAALPLDAIDLPRRLAARRRRHDVGVHDQDAGRQLSLLFESGAQALTGQL